MFWLGLFIYKYEYIYIYVPDIKSSWHHHALSNKIKRGHETLTAIHCTNFLVWVTSSFVGKLYTHQRSEHIPGVRFCKCLLVNLLTGRYVCFSYFASLSLRKTNKTQQLSLRPFSVFPPTFNSCMPEIFKLLNIWIPSFARFDNFI